MKKKHKKDILQIEDLKNENIEKSEKVEELIRRLEDKDSDLLRASKMIDALRLKADLMTSKLMRENISPIKTPNKSPKFNQNNNSNNKNRSQQNTPTKSFATFD